MTIVIVLVKKLQNEIQFASKPDVKIWFENYLKNAISYRGCKTPEICKIVDHWCEQNKVVSLPTAVQLNITVKLLEQDYSEDKFAGILLLQKYLINSIGSQQILECLDRLFRAGYFYGWATTDWLSSRVLDKMIAKFEMPIAKEIAEWRFSNILWQRRASIVSFRSASVDKKYHKILVRIIDDLVTENERFIQTAIGWLISDMSKVWPQFAEKIVEKHFSKLSDEVIKRHTKFLPKHKNTKT